LIMLAMASLAARAHERVGGIGSGRNAAYGRSALLRLAEWITVENANALPQANALLKNAAAVVVSDFLDEPSLVAKSLGAIAERGVRGHMVQIADPAEETLPYDGRVEFLGLDKPLRYLSPKTQNLRQAYIEKYQEHRDALQEIARSLGWSFQVHRTDVSPMATLLALYSKVSDANAIRMSGGA
jgi:uncharacterized protein (DUF58 family)